jgi:hypothetical protein
MMHTFSKRRTLTVASVTIGMLIALAAQQWAEGRNWQSKAKASKAALRDELALPVATVSP